MYIMYLELHLKPVYIIFITNRQKRGDRMIFQSLPIFFGVYILLVILSVLSIIYEEKLIKIEQQIKERVSALWHRFYS